MNKSWIPKLTVALVVLLAAGLSFSAVAEDAKQTLKPSDEKVGQALFIGDMRLPGEAGLCSIDCGGGDTFETDADTVIGCACDCATVCNATCEATDGTETRTCSRN